MADTQAKTEALLPCPFVPLTNILADYRSGVKFALAYHGRVLEVLDISHQRTGCIRVGIKGLPVILREDGSFNETAPIWLFRPAQPKPEVATDDINELSMAKWRAKHGPSDVAPDDEALLQELMDLCRVAVTTGRVDALEKMRARKEALRRRIAELQARASEWQAETHKALARMDRAEDRAETAEAALAACRDKTIDECAGVASGAVRRCHSDGSVAVALTIADEILALRESEMAGSVRHVIERSKYRGHDLLENHRDAIEAVEELVFVVLSCVPASERRKALDHFYKCCRGEKPWPAWWAENSYHQRAADRFRALKNKDHKHV